MNDTLPSLISEEYIDDIDTDIDAAIDDIVMSFEHHCAMYQVVLDACASLNKLEQSGIGNDVLVEDTNMYHYIHDLVKSGVVSNYDGVPDTAEVGSDFTITTLEAAKKDLDEKSGKIKGILSKKLSGFTKKISGLLAIKDVATADRIKSIQGAISDMPDSANGETYDLSKLTGVTAAYESAIREANKHHEVGKKLFGEITGKLMNNLKIVGIGSDSKLSQELHNAGAQAWHVTKRFKQQVNTSLSDAKESRVSLNKYNQNACKSLCKSLDSYNSAIHSTKNDLKAMNSEMGKTYLKSFGRFFAMGLLNAISISGMSYSQYFSLVMAKAELMASYLKFLNKSSSMQLKVLQDRTGK